MVTMTKMKKNDQSGMVSFMITLIMMMVISLIVIGFTQVTNRNRRETLDRQLSAQAFYAAESGVNAATRKIKSDLSAPGGVIKKQTTCSPGANDYMTDTDLSGDGGTVSYTCVLVNPVVKDIRASANTNESKIVYIETVDSSGGPLGANQINFSWTKGVGSMTPATNCPLSFSGTFLKPSSYTCGYGVLRVDLTQVTGAQTDAQSLNNSTKAFYFVPTKSNQPIYLVSNTFANIVPVQCDDQTCVGMLKFSAGGGKYYARISSIYLDAESVTIDSGVDPGSGAAKEAYFKNQEVQIDATGKAHDVFRRVQVRLPLNQYDAPAGVQTQDSTCKRFEVYPGYYASKCTIP